jgi:hypothetical protein
MTRMVYTYADGVWTPRDDSCRWVGHTWPRRFPWWRRLLGLSQTCGRCGTQRRVTS